MSLTGYRYASQDRNGETVYRTARHVSHDQLMRMLELWSAGKDTAQIAQAIGLPEHEVANRLPMLREEFRSVRAGG